MLWGKRRRTPEEERIRTTFETIVKRVEGLYKDVSKVQKKASKHRQHAEEADRALRAVEEARSILTNGGSSADDEAHAEERVRLLQRTLQPASSRFSDVRQCLDDLYHHYPEHVADCHEHLEQLRPLYGNLTSVRW